jgi:hypothetical protein
MYVNTTKDNVEGTKNASELTLILRYYLQAVFPVFRYWE